MNAFVTIAVIVLLIILIHHLNTRIQLKEKIEASGREREEFALHNEILQLRAERISCLRKEMESDENYKKLLSDITKEVRREIMRALPENLETRLFSQMGEKTKAVIQETVFDLLQGMSYDAKTLIHVNYGIEDIQYAIREEIEAWTGEAITIAESRLAKRYSLEEVGESFVKTRARIRQIDKKPFRKLDPK